MGCGQKSAQATAGLTTIAAARTIVKIRRKRLMSVSLTILGRLNNTAQTIFNQL